MIILGCPIYVTMYEEVIHTLKDREIQYNFFDFFIHFFNMEEKEFKIRNPKFVTLGYGDPWKRRIFLFPLILNSPTVYLQLTALLFHTVLISKGETCIEFQINKQRRKFARSNGMKYKNYFDYGPKKNWIKFLGLENRKIWSIFLPSKFFPNGDEHSWKISA